MKSSSSFLVGKSTGDKLYNEDSPLVKQMKLEYFLGEMLRSCKSCGSKVGTPDFTQDVEKLFKLYAEAIDILDQIKTLEEKINEKLSKEIE